MSAEAHRRRAELAQRAFLGRLPADEQVELERLTAELDVLTPEEEASLEALTWLAIGVWCRRVRAERSPRRGPKGAPSRRPTRGWVD